MNITEIKDGGSEVYRGEHIMISLGVIHLVVQNGEEKPTTITGYCKPEIKPGLIRTLNENILWV